MKLHHENSRIKSAVEDNTHLPRLNTSDNTEPAPIIENTARNAVLRHGPRLFGVAVVISSLLIFSAGFITLQSIPEGAGAAPTARAYIPRIEQSLAPTPGVPAGVAILANHSTFIDKTDQLHIVGEVQNNSTEIGMPSFEARLFGQYGNLVDRHWGVMHGSYGPTDWVEIIKPGAKRCIEFIFPIKPPRWASYQLSVTAFDRSAYYTDMSMSAFVDDTSTSLKAGGDYQLIGRLTSYEDYPVSVWGVEVTLYDVTEKGNWLRHSTSE